MKKLFLILLLAIVPFQFAWSAAGAYCQHEKGVAAQHFGHHAHQHHQAKTDLPDTKSKLGKVHLDCHSCHSAGFAIAVTDVVPDIVPVPPAYAEPLPQFFTSFIPDGPRRPDRFPVA